MRSSVMGSRARKGTALSRRRTRMGRSALAAAVLAVMALAAVLTINGLTGAGHQAHRGTAAAASSPPAAVPPQLGPAGGPSQPPTPARESLVPASGAYLGAYVQPAAYTQLGQITAVQSLENQVGRPLAIVHVYRPWGKALPAPADAYFAEHGKILLLTWGGNPDTRAIVAGRDDAMIRAAARAIKALGHPVMLEFRHEMDRPNLQWTIGGPASYIAAWDHIRAIFAAARATSVSWVWCPTGLGFASGRAQRFYPGSNEVDWVCADVYSTSTAQSLSAAAAPFLRWASYVRKPVIIGEFGVMGGNPGGWPAWLAAAGRLPQADRQVKAMVYFDANGVDSSGHAYEHWLASHPPALSEFARLLGQPVFRAAVPSGR